MSSSAEIALLWRLLCLGPSVLCGLGGRGVAFGISFPGSGCSACSTEGEGPGVMSMSCCIDCRSDGGSDGGSELISERSSLGSSDTCSGLDLGCGLFLSFLIRLPRVENFIDCPSPSKDPVGISMLMPLKEGSILGTGGGSSMLISGFNSIDFLLKPGHLRSDQRDPGLEPGRETGRGAASLTTMLGTLRSEGTSEWLPTDLNERVSPPPDVDGLSPSRLLEKFTPATAVAGRAR